MYPPTDGSNVDQALTINVNYELGFFFKNLMAPQRNESRDNGVKMVGVLINPSIEKVSVFRTRMGHTRALMTFFHAKNAVCADSSTCFQLCSGNTLSVLTEVSFFINDFRMVRQHFVTIKQLCCL